ncbi:MAG: hypothetical protein M1335_01230 [Chloroflexi bacterium]|nr:hypothetical protein [Chloroflexota bacterium]
MDERIVELATMAQLPAKNPVFKNKERTVADIVPNVKGAEETAEAAEADDDEPDEDESADEEEYPKETTEDEEEEEEGEEEDEEEGDERVEATRHRKQNRRHSKLALVFAAFVVLIGGGYAVATYALPQVTINVTLKKTSFDFNDSVSASASTTVPSVAGSNISLPGQLFTAPTGSLVMDFPATGTSSVSEKAAGVLTVYNAYSSAPQVLVATTRFVSPDGHLFRSTEKITVPGAKVAGGKLTPSSAQVNVVAAESGPAYNLSPSDHWTIPGFAGTPRYAKFYADAPQGTTGGSDGTSIVATKADIAAATAKAEASLQDSLENQLNLLKIGALKVLPGTMLFATTSEKVTPVGTDGHFSVLVSGNLKEMAFDEDMLKNAILTQAGADASSTKLDSIDITYGTTTLNAGKGLLTFKASGSLTYEPAVDVQGVKSQIAGQNAASLKSIIFGITGLEKANISFWPFWVSTVPQDQSKIQLNLD